MHVSSAAPHPPAPRSSLRTRNGGSVLMLPSWTSGARKGRFPLNFGPQRLTCHSHNEIASLDADWPSLPALVSLKCDHNAIPSLPPSVCSLDALKQLVLSQCVAVLGRGPSSPLTAQGGLAIPSKRSPKRSGGWPVWSTCSWRTADSPACHQRYKVRHLGAPTARRLSASRVDARAQTAPRLSRWT